MNTSERHVYRISAQKVTRLLLLTVLCLTLASLGSQFLIYIWGSNGLLAPPQTFNTGHDTNIPTWYSSFALFLSSILLAIIATAKKRNKDRYTLHWFFLFGIFLLLSIDEVAMIHESTQVWVDALLMSIIGKPSSGLLYYSWVIPAIVFAVVTFLCYLRFLAHLPKRMKRLLFAAGSIFVMGAIGMEMLSSRLQSPYGWRNWETIPDSIKIIIGLQTAVEELFEMIGVVIFVYALLSYV